MADGEQPFGKQYYYWLRNVRKAAVNEIRHAAETNNKELSSVSFVEIPAQEIFSAGEIPAITIRTKKSAIEISTEASECLMIEVVNSVPHTL